MGQEEVTIKKIKCKNIVQTKIIVNIQLYKIIKN
jgi:hypothetical protein